MEGWCIWLHMWFILYTSLLLCAEDLLHVKRVFTGLITPASRNLQMLSLSSHFSMTIVGHDPHSPVRQASSPLHRSRIWHYHSQMLSILYMRQESGQDLSEIANDVTNLHLAYKAGYLPGNVMQFKPFTAVQYRLRSWIASSETPHSRLSSLHAHYLPLRGEPPRQYPVNPSRMEGTLCGKLNLLFFNWNIA